MIVYCTDCDHWFIEHPVDTEADLMVCPFCDGENYDAYDEDAGVDSFKEGHENGR